MNKTDEAVECFKSGFSCSQAVFSTYCGMYGLDKTTGLKIATSLGGGMGHTDGACGAVTSAYLLLGLVFGKSNADDKISKDKTYMLVQEFSNRFKKINGSVQCTDLIGYNLSTDEGFAKAREENRFHTLCTKYIKDSAEIVQDLIEESI